VFGGCWAALEAVGHGFDGCLVHKNVDVSVTRTQAMNKVI
jgi:hypothetical protein